MNIKYVYLADDDMDDVEFFQEALTDVCDTVVFDSGKNGIELLKKLLYPELPAPDIIFLDINMPLMNGLECLKEIKAHQHLKDIPVVMYSTSVLPATLETAFSLGASLFIEKTPEFQELKNILKPIISWDWSVRSRPATAADLVFRAN